MYRFFAPMSVRIMVITHGNHCCYGHFQQYGCHSNEAHYSNIEYLYCGIEFNNEIKNYIIHCGGNNHL